MSTKIIDTNTDFEVLSLDSPDFANQSEIKHPWYFNWRYSVLGIFFGFILVKTEVISWFRIQEMFRLQSFHMYGVIGTAVLVGAISVAIIKRFHIKTIEGETVRLPKRKFQKGQIIGGLLFGFGWAITGACPGPIYAQIGAGFPAVIITLFSAIAGTWVYGYLRDRLPH